MEACLSQAAAGSGLARQREGLVGHPGGWAGQRVSQKSIPSSRHQGAGQRGCPRTRPHKGGSAPGILGSPGTSGVGSNLFSLSFPSSFSCLSSPPSACSLPLPLSFSALVASLLPPCFRTCRLSLRHRFHVPLLSCPSLVMPPPRVSWLTLSLSSLPLYLPLRRSRSRVPSPLLSHLSVLCLRPLLDSSVLPLTHRGTGRESSAALKRSNVQ